MALRLGRGDLAGEAGDRVGIDAELALPHQRLARELEQDAVEARAGHAGGLSSRCNKGGHAFMARAAPLPTAKQQLRCLSDRLGLLRAGGRGDFGGEVAPASSRCLRRAGSGRSPSSAMRAPASLAAAATTSATGVLLSITNSCDEQRILLAELGEAALDHLLDDVLRLAAFLRLFHRDRALALDQRRRRGRRPSAPAGAPRRRASRSACRARSACRPAPRSRARPARRSCRGPARPGCGRRARPRPRSLRATAARRSDWFSPILAMLSVSFSCDGAAVGIWRRAERLDVGAVLERELGDVADEVLEHARSWRRSRSRN